MLRHLLSILLLPFMVIVVVPYSLLNAFAAVDTQWGNGILIEWISRITGGIFLLSGLGLLGWCIRLFASVGQGTLAPWDPTTNMVAVGPYRYVRNPMISGVALVLIGEALLLGSWIIGMWAGVFILINHTYFLLSEEPGLENRFGEPYREYKTIVPRWIPRLKPWVRESPKDPKGF
jgi:protein-S-isoprenylcysteine O-methyltransferase Ste14